MSEEMKRKKQEEIENLEKAEAAVIAEVSEDRCPGCGMPTAQLEFFNAGIIKTFGWVECTNCGSVYCPKSILKQKRLLAKSGLTPAIHTPDGPPASLVLE